MAITSPEVKAALETIFAADSEFYRGRGFQRRIGYGTRPALVVIDMANAWTRPGYAFTCDNMDEIIPATQALLAAAREKRIPVVFTTTAYQDPTGPRSDTGLWHLKIPAETLLEGSEAASIDDRLDPQPGEQVIVKKRASALYGSSRAASALVDSRLRGNDDNGATGVRESPRSSLRDSGGRFPDLGRLSRPCHMSTRTTLLLDDEVRTAARELAHRYGCSTSEAIRRAVLRHRDAVLGIPRSRRNARDFAGIPGLVVEG